MRITFTGPNYDYYTADLTGAELEVLVKIASKSRRLASYPNGTRIVTWQDDKGKYKPLDLGISVVGDCLVITKQQADADDLAASAAEESAKAE